MIGLLRFAPWLIAAAGIAAAAFLFWQNGRLHEKNGALEQAARTYAAALAGKVEATKGRAVTQQKVRQMAPAEKLERLK